MLPWLEITKIGCYFKRKRKKDSENKKELLGIINMKAKLKIHWEKECKVEKILEVEQKYNKLKNKREEIFRNRESIHIWLWLIGVPERTPSKQMEVNKKKIR